MMLKKWMAPVAAFMALQAFSITYTEVAEAGLGDGGAFASVFQKSPKLAPIKPGTVMQLANGISYQIMDNANSYEEAYKYASSVGGRLAFINEPADCQMLYNFMVAQKIDSAYIGLADHMFAGKWRWPNGTSPKFYNWKKGEPDRSNKKNRYAMLSKQNKKGTWSAGPFRRKNPTDPKIYYIIQWDPNEKTLRVDEPKPVYHGGWSAPVYRQPAEDVIEG